MWHISSNFSIIGFDKPLLVIFPFSFLNSYKEENIPHHPCMRLVSNCEQTMNLRISRRLITMEKIHPYRVSTEICFYLYVANGGLFVYGFSSIHMLQCYHERCCLFFVLRWYQPRFRLQCFHWLSERSLWNDPGRDVVGFYLHDYVILNGSSCQWNIGDSFIEIN